MAVRDRRRVHRVRERRRRAVRIDQGPRPGAARGVADPQRRLGQGRPRGGRRRLGLLRRQRRRRQHRRDRQVPEHGGAHLALDGGQRVPRRDVRLREVEPALDLPDAGRRPRRLAGRARQRRARRHGRGEARQHRLHHLRPYPTWRTWPEPQPARLPDVGLGAAPGTEAAPSLRGRLVDAGVPAVRRLARRSRQRQAAAEALDRRDADGGRADRRRQTTPSRVSPPTSTASKR